MIHRICKPLKSNSFFLFGARATGKTTFLREHFKNQKTLHFDFLNPATEEEYALHPGKFLELIKAQKGQFDWVVLDEIQKVPKLLNSVHSLIESDQIKFAMTGSSARKLRRGEANLLAGRAYLNYLFPLVQQEYHHEMQLLDVLNYGSLPKLHSLPSSEEKEEYLKSYVTTYIQEEIKLEQLVRNLDPFRKFLEVAAQSNAKIVNYTNIHREIGVDVKTVQNFYSILEDTMIGVFLEPFHTSMRKVLSQKPKFYFFDIGVQKALSRSLRQRAVPQTSYYGELFETMIILECHRLNHYHRTDYQFYYLKTKDDAEINLVIKGPNKSLVLVEIKSSTDVKIEHLKKFIRLTNDFKGARKICICDEKEKRIVDGVEILPWRMALDQLFCAHKVELQ